MSQTRDEMAADVVQQVSSAQVRGNARQATAAINSHKQPQATAKSNSQKQLHDHGKPHTHTSVYHINFRTFSTQMREKSSLKIQ